MVRRRATILPFRRDQSARFLPWIVAVMVFLGVLTVAFALITGNGLTAWNSQLTGRLTVQIPALENGADAPRLSEALQVVRELPGVGSAEILGTAAVSALLEPWIGDLPADADLPIPHLIDVTVADQAAFDSAALTERLAAVAPGATVDDHRIWLSELIRLAQTVRLVALFIVLLVGLSALAAVVFATRSGLAIHAPTIELLHIMGAQDSFVAILFQRHAMVLGLRGSLVGGVLAVAVLVAMIRLASGIDAAFVPTIALRPTDWLFIGAVPVATVLLVMATARLTVIRALARMD